MRFFILDIPHNFSNREKYDSNLINMPQIQQKSAFHQYRSKYQPRAPLVLKEQVIEGVYETAKVPEEVIPIFPKTIENGVRSLTFRKGEEKDNIIHALRVGCVLSGGQAPGGHNVIVGIYDFIKRIHKNSQLFGFLNGPKGIFTGSYVEINESQIDYFKNRGGFDMICSGRDKIQKPEEFEKSLKYCESLKLDGLVVIGGDDSNTNAALLAEYFLSKGSKICVVGCPKTIDGDLKNEFVEVSFGFDTACKTYSECIGSIMTDTFSSKKYYHFIRLMGRSASHIALECALLTKPTYTFIGEEVEEKKQTLQQLVAHLVEIIIKRAAQGKNYGVVLIPQGLVEFIPQMNVLISEINKLVAGTKSTDPQELKSLILDKLSPESKMLFEFLPKEIASQLLLDRDPHGNVQVAKIETEKLIIELVLQELRKKPDYKGKFSPLANYFGYEGRCAFPTNFDCDYCYSLGLNAGAIIEAGLTGLMSCVRNLYNEPEEWLPGGYPLVTMMNIETRKGKQVPVIKKALVTLDGPLFKLFDSRREDWALGDFFKMVASSQYEFPEVKPYLAVPPSPEQYYTPTELATFKDDERPFAVINDFNVSPLSQAIGKLDVDYPRILDHSPHLIYSDELKFSTKELKIALEHEYPFLAKQGHQIVTFKQGTEKQTKNIRIGISFNGRQAPGGHNIILGLLGDHTEVFGFIGGNKGIFQQKWIKITQENMKHYVNQSGFHLLGRSSDRLRTKSEFQQTEATCKNLDLDGLILVGASHTLTDGAMLSNYFMEKGIKTVVNCVPCTIDNNVQHKDLQISVGFATSSHTYSTLISNLMIDASSNTKYWYFIRLMGRDPSHLTLECALSTKPNYTIISEQVAHKGWDLEDIVNDIVRVVVKRQETGRNFGCILIPEGLPTFLPSICRIKTELDQIKAKDEKGLEKMSAWARERFERLPEFIRKQLFCRDDSNELAVSQIQSQKLLAYLVSEKLKELKKEGKYKGSFSSVCHFLGYQGRCAIPTQFDRNVAFTYGRIARILVQKGLTGYCSSARGLVEAPSSWFPLALPITHICELKEKSKYGVYKPIVNSANVSLKSPVFIDFEEKRGQWELIDHYSNPGPIQYFGEMKSYVPFTVSLEQNYDFKLIEDINKKIKRLNGVSKFGTDTLKLQLIHKNISNLLQVLELIELAQE